MTAAVWLVVGSDGRPFGIAATDVGSCERDEVVSGTVVEYVPSAERDKLLERVAMLDEDVASLDGLCTSHHQRAVEAERERDALRREVAAERACRLANEAELHRADALIGELRREVAASRVVMRWVDDYDWSLYTRPDGVFSCVPGAVYSEEEFAVTADTWLGLAEALGLGLEVP